MRIVSRYVVLDRDWDLDGAIAQLRRFTGEDLVFRTIPTGRVDLQTPVDGIAVEIDQDAVRSVRRVGPRPVGPGRAADRRPVGDRSRRPPARGPARPRPGRPAVRRPELGGHRREPPIHASRVITADGIPCVN